MSDIVARLRRWTHDVNAVPASDLMDDAADEIERLRPRWISVTERLPELMEPVLCCWSRQKLWTGVAWRREWLRKTIWAEVDGFDEIDEPIAWMPLPEPPEVK